MELKSILTVLKQCTRDGIASNMESFFISDNKISAFNSFQGCSFKTEQEFPISGFVNGKRFSDAVSKMGDFTFATNKDKLQIKGAGVKVNLKVEKNDDYLLPAPDMMNEDTDFDHYLLDESFFDIVKFGIKFTNPRGFRSFQRGMVISGNNVFVTGDGIAILSTSYDFKKDEIATNVFVVPQAFMKLMLSMNSIAERFDDGFAYMYVVFNDKNEPSSLVVNWKDCFIFTYLEQAEKLPAFDEVIAKFVNNSEYSKVESIDFSLLKSVVSDICICKNEGGTAIIETNNTVDSVKMEVPWLQFVEEGSYYFNFPLFENICSTVDEIAFTKINNILYGFGKKGKMDVLFSSLKRGEGTHE